MTTLIKKTQPVPVFTNLFDDVFAKDLFNWNDKNFAEFGNTLPSVNIKESDKEYGIEMAVPGMKKDQFKINLDKNMLTISAENTSENDEKDENGKYTRREFKYQTFSRSFTLPSDRVDAEHISANYEDGILNVVIPKILKEEQQVKTIEVN